jgi:hypothetical protein
MRLAPALLLAAAGVSLAARPLRAEPPPPAPAEAPAAANALFRRAQALYEKREYAAALPMFRELSASVGSPIARLYVALCLRELGELPEAYDELGAVIAEVSARAEKEPRALATRDAAAGERAALEKRIGRVVVTVPNAPAGVEVRVAGKPLAPARLGTPIALLPGAVTVTATAPGRVPARRDLTLAAGALETVTLSLDAPAPAAAPAPLAPRAPVAPASRPFFSRLTPLQWAGAGVAVIGVGGFVTAAVAGALANARFHEVRDACGGMRCVDPAEIDRIDGGRHLDTVANVHLVVGVVGVVAGGAMIFFGRPRARAAAPSIGLAPTPGGGVLSGRF